MSAANVTGSIKPTRARRDSVVQHVTSNGRTVTFLATDLIPGRPLRLWGALVEVGDNEAGGDADIEGTGGIERDVAGYFIRLGILGANDGWSVTQLLAVAQARYESELARTGAPDVEVIVSCLERAVALHREALDDEPVYPVGFEPGAARSSYAWTVARAGLFSIALCPDAEGHVEGVTPEQLLAVLDLALSAWLPVTPWRYRTWATRLAVRGALAIQSGRVTGA